MEDMNDLEIRIALARLDERHKAMEKETARTEISNREALALASGELARRLDILNHAHQEAIRVQGTYVPREMYERDKREMESRISKLELSESNLKGRLWLPMIGIAALAAGLSAAAVKLLFP